MSNHRMNVVGVETVFGLKTLELVAGDVTQLQSDLLAVSAFAGSYLPTPQSVIGALKRDHGLSLREEARRPAIDLRRQFGVWVTQPLRGLPFARVICVEIVGAVQDPGEAIQNLFVGLAVLEAMGIEVRSLAMPVLGTGDQGIDPDKIVPPLLAKATEALRRSLSLERIQVAAFKQADAEALSAEIDKQFGARTVRLPGRELVPALLKEIEQTCVKLRGTASGLEAKLLEEIRQSVSQNPSATDIGVIARKMAEFVVDAQLGQRQGIDLFQKINNLGSIHVAPWIVTYLHMLRVVGNEVVHIRDVPERKPAGLAEDDMALCLFCVLRVLQFWQSDLKPAI